MILFEYENKDSVYYKALNMQEFIALSRFNPFVWGIADPTRTDYYRLRNELRDFVLGFVRHEPDIKGFEFPRILNGNEVNTLLTHQTDRAEYEIPSLSPVYMIDTTSTPFIYAYEVTIYTALARCLEDVKRVFYQYNSVWAEKSNGRIVFLFAVADYRRPFEGAEEYMKRNWQEHRAGKSLKFTPDELLAELQTRIHCGIDRIAAYAKRGAEGRKLTKGDRLRMISGIEETKQYVDEFRKWQFNLGRV